MESIISDFHIDYKLLIAQTFNFGLVVFVLYLFAFKPIVKIMADRTKKIDQGLKDAELSKKNLAESEAQSQIIIKDSKKQADTIVAAASNQAEKLQKKAIIDAKEKAETIISGEKEKFAADKEMAWQDFKKEAGDLIIDVAGKLLDEKMTDEADANFIKKLIN